MCTNTSFISPIMEGEKPRNIACCCCSLSTAVHCQAHTSYFVMFTGWLQLLGSVLKQSQRPRGLFGREGVHHCPMTCPQRTFCQQMSSLQSFRGHTESSGCSATSLALWSSSLHLVTTEFTIPSPNSKAPKKFFIIPEA